MSNATSVTHVLYDANCPDGFGAAFAAWKVVGDQAIYLPVRHGEDSPDIPAQAHVAVVDLATRVKFFWTCERKSPV